MTLKGGTQLCNVPGSLPGGHAGPGRTSARKPVVEKGCCPCSDSTALRPGGQGRACRVQPRSLLVPPGPSVARLPREGWGEGVR